MSKDFKAVYKILQYLSRNMGNEDAGYEMIAAETLGIAECRWEQILIELQEEGYIKGLVVTQSLGDYYPHIAEPIRPRITLKGLEYLEENSQMKKARQIIEGIVNIVK